MKTSEFMKLGKADFWKTALMVGMSVVIASVGKIVMEGDTITLADLKVIGVAGLSAGLAYVIKNLLTNSDDQFLTFEKDDQLPKN